ncbi:MAG: DUF2851 family protein [Duncaniella sp.]|uniref:DUF2851 family protein n=1 Tax=Duncaniella sp. TaxID=2518496 RepID=UPI0023C5E82C|nr:DUF2851 family protein [Duncaniella sp.]MDE5989136.1 DUF2851 family protein [Duncaniella sp.]MDE6174494.1 DUF2851 family protein [Duncaniella sp.]
MERLMQYVWQHRLLEQTDMVTVDGRKVTVIDPGRLNTDAGPDFFNAKIKLGDAMWAGDVEIHVRASDWHRHRHDADSAYNSVVLHVVDRDDTAIRRHNGEVIPQMVMRCEPEFHVRYHELVDRADIDLPCAGEIKTMDSLRRTDWLTALAYERVYSKTGRVEELLRQYTGDWEQTCYVVLARALGFSTNSEPMERLAMSLPLHFLRKHSDSPLAIEALFFGQGGFLDNAPKADPYVGQLIREHRFFAHKFSLRPLQPLGWKMARMRPHNFPHRRIALLAQLVASDFRLVRRIIQAASVEEVRGLFRQPLNGYWASHFTFGPGSERSFETLSKSSADILIINVAIPLMMAYGEMHGDEEMGLRAMEWLQQLPSENNSIVSLFTGAGIGCKDAFTSQALIQLRRCYCEQRKCLYCRLGHTLLASKARRSR